ncbi:hypothetical protein QFZ42_003355 [Variovorax paradoxus]|uniref:hypothetical protein n=1 Tax=Variovorax paradoxus TaxID=34073 RepID=UPI00279497E5|nr:hypothetical protein [Variovorax paradoxus]MDQ0571521.1 hypothetical protein [Variovorax paradoxus]
MNTEPTYRIAQVLGASGETGELPLGSSGGGSAVLPELPEAYDGVPHREGLGILDAYTADQMHEYALAAIAAATGARV